jgi:hypothetical protein
MVINWKKQPWVWDIFYIYCYLVQQCTIFQDDLQNRVFQEKRQLCSRVRAFSDEYGLLAMMKNPKGFPFQHRRLLNTSEG